MSTRRTIARLWMAALLVVGWLLLAPALASAQEATLPARLGSDARETIGRLADSLRAAGVPSDPLYAKAAEGVLKGADDARIVVAVRTLARELGQARATLGPAAPGGDVTAAASALHAGVPAASIRRLRDAGSGSLALPLVVLADLAARGVPANAAAGSIAALVSRGASETELSGFRAGVERDIASGRDARAAADARLQATLLQLDRRGAARPRAAGTPPIAPLP
ncbi:MAG: hypothetical protein ACXWZ4_06880 [Gemmatirosa sp.]